MISTPVRLLVALATLVFPILAQDSPDSALRGAKIFEQREVVRGLENPWEVTWGPDGFLWVTERSGKRVTRIHPETGEKKVAATIDEVSAPGGQDGLLGMALHPDLLKGKDSDYVYVAYTYVDREKGPDPSVPDEANPYRYLYGKIVRFTYDQESERLTNPVELIRGLPAGNDHNGGRLKIGPDERLYFTIGDMGNNQLGNFCLAVEAQRLPTQQEIRRQDYAAYVGKSLRLNLDGSAPRSNPKLEGVRSHVYTYGHRNIQGIDFGPEGTLYAAEHGPKTDDEINILEKGWNYGWPHVAGLQDNKAYEYARWAEASTACDQLGFSDLAIHPSVPREPESAFQEPFKEPIATLFTVESDYDFADPACGGVHYICWPTIGISGVERYQSSGPGIPGWQDVLLVTALKRGSLYTVPLTPDGQESKGRITRYFQSENRFRDTAVSPDGMTVYVAMDAGGLAEAISGGVTRRMQNPGAIVAFTYQREADGPIEPVAPTTTLTQAAPSSGQPGSAAAQGPPPRFTAEQAAEGKTAYNAHCAVCHGNTLQNGTFGTPLAGEYFDGKWNGQTVKAFLAHSKTMPPADPGSLPDDVYANILAYVFAVNGFDPGEQALPSKAEELGGMVIRPRADE